MFISITQRTRILIHKEITHRVYRVIKLISTQIAQKRTSMLSTLLGRGRGDLVSMA